MYYIIYRNTQGRLGTTIHHKPLTKINIGTGVWLQDDDSDEMSEERVEVPCIHVDLKKKYHNE